MDTSVEASTPPHDEKPHPVVIVLDDEPLQVPDDEATPNDLLRLANLDPATHYLVLLKGRERESFKGNGDEIIKLHEDERFVSVSTEPTPTS